MSDTASSSLPGGTSRRELLFGGAAAAAAATAYARMPDKPLKSVPDDALAKIVPQTVGDWTYETTSGLVLPPPDQLARLLYSQQLTRTYVSPDRPSVMLLLAYGSSQGGMMQIHRPEICYPASGFTLSDVTVSPLDLGSGREMPMRRFTARSDTRVEQVLYWTRIADFLPASWAQQRLAVVRSNLAGYIPDGLLGRLSIQTDDAAAAQAVLAEFMRTMLTEMAPARQRMLIGNAV
ncbi:exosortase-associated protein EpsI, V-type [uncultured Sphingomonas sp.]|uniref:exosortase-associated protein EpsI, V-type n=1 Tax=uncultured Sphingomonas sp. TaxID=158754 RepID=UPI0025E199F9|nr:exosortase-associated protein EpsI, V-type [uncultured Sphingomonas sp.]